MPQCHLVTSALPYANGPLHLGHLAGAYLPADVYVRYLRSSGKDVLWVCGSDEHGAAISTRAKREGRSEREIVDHYHGLFKRSFADFDISFDMYHRTSSELHHVTSQELFKQLVGQGDQFEVRTSEQYYDESEDSFLADRFIQGTCPNCAYPDAFGDQCENCGKDLSPTELINPRSTLSGKTPTLRETKHWYFRLDRHEEWLREYIAEGRLDERDKVGSHHDASAWRNHVTGQCLSWLDAGLQPRAYTRDLDWGIPVPLPNAEGKVLYVWFDAPIGYISATKQWAIDRGDPDAWKRYWKDPSTELVHFIGKDNIVFHCLTFQATLKALGDYNLASNVPANQFLNFEGDKFSKSRGWGIQMDEYLETFASFPNHVDAMRYALIRNMPENKDADFKWDDFVAFHDKELADKLGNFVNRTLVLSHKYFAGRVPPAPTSFAEAFGEVRARVRQVDEQLAAFSFKGALATVMSIVDLANTDLQERAPWLLAKANPNDPRIAEALYLACQSAAVARVLFEPFIPGTAARLADLLNLPKASVGSLLASESGALLPDGHQLGEPALLFAKIHDRKDDSRLKLIQAQREKLDAIRQIDDAKDTPQHTPVKPTIRFEDFTKLDVRTGIIASAEVIPKADKLLKLSVDLGFESRTIVSGIAQHFDPAALPGKRCLVLVNLAPRKLRGVESQGMILMAENGLGELQFVATDGESPAGMPIS